MGCLWAIILLFGTIACQSGDSEKSEKKDLGKSEKKYVGVYVHKDKYDIQIVELKSDGRYNYVCAGKDGEKFSGSSYWEVKRAGNEEYIFFYEPPPVRALVPGLVKKGEDLYAPATGEFFVKQKRAIHRVKSRGTKTSTIPKALTSRKYILATYVLKSTNGFLELRKGGIYFFGESSKWKLTVSYYADPDAEYEITVNMGGEPCSAYIEEDTIPGLSDLDFVKYEKAKLVEGGYGKLWSMYVDPENEAVIEFKNNGNCVVGFFGKWKKRGDTLMIYLKGEKKPGKFKIKGETLLAPDGSILVKQK